MDLSSRLRAIVKSGPPKPLRELTYEPDTGGYEGTIDLSRVGAILGGCAVGTPFGQCLVVDRRYEADRFHGDMRIGDCDVDDAPSMAILDPGLAGSTAPFWGQTPDGGLHTGGQTPDGQLHTGRRTIFIDLETTGLSGGAGTVASGIFRRWNSQRVSITGTSNVLPL